jgi:hypothetical protein
MSLPSSRIRGNLVLDAILPNGTTLVGRDCLLEQATWAFVILGVLLRFARYAMDYPLWWDEAFVAVNFIRRDYVDLLWPLDYGQICPIFFLWAELTVVKLFGFSEWSLRLFPLVCGVASVVLFRHVAGRVVRRVPLLMAVAIFAVSFHPIRHAADVKPYASDLLVALALLALAFEWSRTPARATWMWTLAAITPVAIALSHPAVFVASGIVLALAPSVVRAGQRRVRLAYTTMALATIATFIFLYAVFTHAQASANLGTMQTQWVAAFPPLSGPLALIKWLTTAHTGSMFAYPCGGERGGSSLTLVLFILGAGALWCFGRRVCVLMCLAPFAMALVAAALKRYPYGGVADGSPARVMQYLVPSICLLSGVGLAVLLALVRDARCQTRVRTATLVALAVIGVVPVVADAFHPYRTVHAQRARQFARMFWPAFIRDAQPVCARWDLGIGEWESSNLNVAVYLCNQMIYSPHRQFPGELRRRTLSAQQPLRCVVPFAEPLDHRVVKWLTEMKVKYHLNAHHTVIVDMAERGGRSRTERYDIYEFTPLSEGNPQPSQLSVARLF